MSPQTRPHRTPRRTLVVASLRSSGPGIAEGKATRESCPTGSGRRWEDSPVQSARACPRDENPGLTRLRSRGEGRCPQDVGPQTVRTAHVLWVVERRLLGDLLPSTRMRPTEKVLRLRIQTAGADECVDVRVEPERTGYEDLASGLQQRSKEI